MNGAISDGYKKMDDDEPPSGNKYQTISNGQLMNVMENSFQKENDENE